MTASVATFTVCIPSYNAQATIADTIKSLLRQTFTDWECLVVDDGSTDDTAHIVKTFEDSRIRFVANEKNLGCAGNFQRCRNLSKGTYLYFLAHDDILAATALERCYQAFRMAPDIAVVTRPYYWFRGSDPDRVVRYTKPLDPFEDRIISIEDDESVLRAILENLGQVSGLAFRNEALTAKFGPYVWTTHIQPFLMALQKQRGVFLHDYPVAVRTEFSQARNLSSIYDPSPLWTWVRTMRVVFEGDRWKRHRKIAIDNIALHPEGVVQLRCHSTFRNFLREAWLYLWYRPKNFLSPKYWFFVMGCLVIPPRLLRRTVDKYMGLYTRPETAGLVTINGSKTFS
jgi:glycosyltransferase involved in cell wall biosynthesis